jgi:hypothetical protein
MEDGLMFKFLPFLFLLSAYSFGDSVKKTSLACPNIDVLKKVGLELEDDPLKLDMYIIANNCVVLERGESIKILDWDGTNNEKIFQKILYNKTGTVMYVRSSSVEIEQAGQNDRIKF